MSSRLLRAGSCFGIKARFPRLRAQRMGLEIGSVVCLTQDSILTAAGHFFSRVTMSAGDRGPDAGVWALSGA